MGKKHWLLWCCIVFMTVAALPALALAKIITVGNVTDLTTVLSGGAYADPHLGTVTLSDGDTIVVDGSGTSIVLNITTTMMANNTVTIKGADGKQVVFANNTANTSGLMNIAPNKTLTLENAVFTDGNKITGSGGAIYISGDSAGNIINSQFSDNAAFNGGAVYINGNYTGDITDSKFTGNTAGDGSSTPNQSFGALYIGGDYTGNMTNTEFSGNTARSGGGAMGIDGDFSGVMDNVIFSNNTAINWDVGALGIGGDFSGTIKNSTFSGNKARTMGAMGIVGDFSGLIDNVTFSNNTASSGAGALGIGDELVGGHFTGTINNATFSNNTATNWDGGAVAIIGNFDGAIKNSAFTDNKAGSWGGAVIIATAGSSSGTIDNVTFSNNTAITGGAIYIDGNYAGDIVNSSFTGNTAGNGSSAPNQSGGAVYIDGDYSGSITDTKFSDNTADSGAGAVAITGNFTGVMDNVTFSNNTATKNDVGALGILEDFSGTIKNSTFSGNKARTMGAMGIVGDFSGLIDNVTFTNNTASSGGGALGIGDEDTGGHFTGTINNATFSNNTATEWDGGALGILGDFDGIIKNSSFTGNKAGSWGGAVILAGSGNVTFENVIFTNNAAGTFQSDGYGGAIAVDVELAAAAVKISLLASQAGDELKFSGNTDSLGSNSIHFGNYGDDLQSSQNATLEIGGNGSVYLLDPIRVQMNNGKTFTFTYTGATGSGYFEWGGTNVVNTDGAATFNFVSGTTSLNTDFVLKTNAAASGSSTKFAITLASGHTMIFNVAGRSANQAFFDLTGSNASSAIVLADNTTIALGKSLTGVQGSYLLIESGNAADIAMNLANITLADDFAGTLRLSSDNKQLWLDVDVASPVVSASANARQSLAAIDWWLANTEEGQAVSAGGFDRLSTGVNTLNPEIGVSAVLVGVSVHAATISAFKSGAFKDNRAYSGMPSNFNARSAQNINTKSGPNGTDLGLDLWVAYLGHFSRNQNKQDYTGYNANTNGVLLGATYHFADEFALGVYGGYSNTDTKFKQSMGKIDTEGLHLGVYGRYTAPFGLIATLDFAYSDFDNDSRRSPAGLGQTKSSFDQRVYSVGLELAYDLQPWDNGHLKPFAEMRQTWIKQDAYTEKGFLAHHLNSISENNFTTTLGLELSQDIYVDNDVKITPSATVGWQHTFGDRQFSTNTSIVGVPVDYAVKSRQQDRDKAMLGLGLDTVFNTGDGSTWRLRFAYGAEIGSKSLDHSVFAGLEFSF